MIVALGRTALVEYNNDGKYIQTESGSYEHLYFDVATGKIRLNPGQYGSVACVALSPDGQLALTGGDDNDVKLWDVKSGQLLHTFTHQIWVFSTAFSPDGRYAISATPSGHVYLWDIQTGKVAKEFIEQEALSSAVMSPDGKLLAAGSYYGSAHLWDVETGQKIYTFSGNTSGANTVAFSPDGKYLLFASQEASNGPTKLFLLPMQGERKPQVFAQAPAPFVAFQGAFSPDGKMLGIDTTYQDLYSINYSNATSTRVASYAGDLAGLSSCPVLTNAPRWSVTLR